MQTLSNSEHMTGGKTGATLLYGYKSGVAEEIVNTVQDGRPHHRPPPAGSVELVAQEL